MFDGTEDMCPRSNLRDLSEMHGLYQAKDVVLRRVSYLWGICILRSVKMILECLYLARLGVMKARISVIRIAREHAESSHEIAPPPFF